MGSAPARAAHSCHPLVLALVGCHLGAGGLQAQATGVLEGIVVETDSGRFLEGVEIRIGDPDRVLRTDAHGAFRFEQLPAGPLVLSARLDGFVTFTDRVVVSASRVYHLEIRLETLVVALEELRVYAARPEPAGVASVAAGPPAADLLNGELLTISRPAQIGGRTAFLIRGLKTLTGYNEPAVFVDGIRVFDFGPMQVSPRGSPGILDQIPPESIDSIRVLRGPSAAARYGAETANGVILIYTKTGRRPAR